MKKVLTNIALFISVTMLALVGCSSTNTQQENTGIGAVTGAVVGGIAGGAALGGTAAVVGGAVVGAVVGGLIGHSMDSSDSMKMSSAMNNQTNHATTWRNRGSNNKYTLVPTSGVMAYKGYSYCRTFKAKAIIGGKKQVTTGVACRQSDGSWRMMD